MTKIVKVDWNNVESINNADREIQKLVNKGYNLVNTITGFTTSEFYFSK